MAASGPDGRRTVLAHDLLFLNAVEANLHAGRPADAARQLQGLGRRLGQPDLEAVGIHAEGRY